MHDADQLSSVAQLSALLSHPDGGLGRLRRSIETGELEAWLETRSTLPDRQRARLTSLFRELESNPANLLFALRYTLDAAAPLELLADCVIRDPTQIAPWLAAQPERRADLLAGLQRLIADGRFGLWLHTVEPAGWERLTGLLDEVRSAYPDEPELPAHAVLWSCAPTAPLPFGDALVTDPRMLARLIDASEQARRLGEGLLERGWIRTWLSASRRLADTAPLDALLRQAELSASARLEALLHLLDPQLPWPDVRVEPASLDLGRIREGETAIGALILTNRGRGSAGGHLHVAAEAGAGCRLDPIAFDGLRESQSIGVRVDGLTEGTRAQARVTVSGNFAEQAASVTWRVGPSAAVARQRWVLAVGGLSTAVVLILVWLGVVGWSLTARDVWTLPAAIDNDILESCRDDRVFRACATRRLKQVGAPDLAVKTTNDEMYPTAARRYGPIWVFDMMQPFAANSNDTRLLLDTKGQRILIDDGVYQLTARERPALAPILESYPSAFPRGGPLGETIARGYLWRAYPEKDVDSRNRILGTVAQGYLWGGYGIRSSDLMVNGCRGCDIVGKIIFEHRFDRFGRYQGLGLVDVDPSVRIPHG